MELNNSQRQAFVLSVLNDVPQEDFSEKARVRAFLEDAVLSALFAAWHSGAPWKARPFT